MRANKCHRVRPGHQILLSNLVIPGWCEATKLIFNFALSTRPGISRSRVRSQECSRPGMTAKPPSLIQKIQRQAGACPIQRDEFTLTGQRDVSRLQFRSAEGDVGGDAVAG